MLEPNAYQKSNCLSSSVRSPFWLPQESVVFHPYAKNPVIKQLPTGGYRKRDAEPEFYGQSRLQDLKVTEAHFVLALKLHGYQSISSFIKKAGNQQSSAVAPSFQRYFGNLAERGLPPEALTRAYFFQGRNSLSEGPSKIKESILPPAAALCFGLRAYIAAKAADLASRFTPYYLRLGQWMLLEGFPIELLKEAEEALRMSNRACFFDSNGFRFVEVEKSLEDVEQTPIQLPGSEFVLPASFLVSEFLDPNKREVSLAGLKSLARIMLLCAMYPGMISRAFVDICGVAFPITMVLPVCRFYKLLPIDFQNYLEQILYTHLGLPLVDLYPSLPLEIAQLKVHLAQAFFHGISQSDGGEPLIFSPSRFSLCSIYLDPSIKENVDLQLRFYASPEAESLLSSTQRKKISVGKSSVSFAAYLLLTVKHLLPDGHELKKQIWYLKAGDEIIALI